MLGPVAAKQDEQNEWSAHEDKAQVRQATWEERWTPVEPDERAQAQAARRAVKGEEAVAARHCKLDQAAAHIT